MATVDEIKAKILLLSPQQQIDLLSKIGGKYSKISELTLAIPKMSEQDFADVEKIVSEIQIIPSPSIPASTPTEAEYQPANPRLYNEILSSPATEFKLEGNIITAGDVKDIIKALEQNTKIKKLDIVGGSISFDDADTLTRSSVVDRIDLSGVNMIGKNTSTSSAAKAPEAPQPEPTTHTIADGDTLTSIAEKYGVTREALVKANGLEENVQIYIGESLKIPKRKVTKSLSSTAATPAATEVEPDPLAAAATTTPAAPTTPPATPTSAPTTAPAPAAPATSAPTTAPAPAAPATPAPATPAPAAPTTPAAAPAAPAAPEKSKLVKALDAAKADAQKGFEDNIKNNPAHIAKIQEALGVKDEKGYGTKTEEAVKGFQGKVGLTQDGKAGKDTLTALSAYQASLDDNKSPQEAIKSAKEAITKAKETEAQKPYASAKPVGNQQKTEYPLDARAQRVVQEAYRQVDKTGMFNSADGYITQGELAKAAARKPEAVEALLRHGVITEEQVRQAIHDTSRNSGRQNDRHDSGHRDSEDRPRPLRELAHKIFGGGLHNDDHRSSKPAPDATTKEGSQNQKAEK